VSVRDILLKDVKHLETLHVVVTKDFVNQNDVQQDDILCFEGYLMSVMGSPRRTEDGYFLVLERAL
jgi:hypothetical protein